MILQNSNIPASADIKMTCGSLCSKPSGSRSKNTAASKAPAENGMAYLANVLATRLLAMSRIAKLSEKIPPIKLKTIM